MSNCGIASSAIEIAVINANIKRNDPLEVKIDKALWLLNRNFSRYMSPKFLCC